MLNWSRQIDGNPRYVNILDGDSIALQTHDNHLYFYSRNGSLLKALGMNSSFHGLSISGDGSYLAASHGPPSPEIDFFKEEILKSAAETIPKQEVVVVANSVDFDAALEFPMFMKNKGAKVVHVSASEFVDRYKQRESVVILGGPDAYEGVGGLVREILSQDEQDMIRQQGSKKMYVKRDVWTSDQKVVVIAGSNREETKAAHQENSEDIASELRL